MMGRVGRTRTGHRASTRAARRAPTTTSIVVGGGHNGLVTAAYLARAGLRTLVLEARSIVGGTAASEPFAGARVNICNCDHTTFRTTPRHRRTSSSPSTACATSTWTRRGRRWRGRAARSWLHHHDVGRTLDELAATYPGEVDGYRRYLRAARPAVELILRSRHRATDGPQA